MIKIAVSGSRSDRSEWELALNTPKDRLPTLTPEQRNVARELHVREDDYQRILLAGRRTAEKLLKKTEWFAKVLQNKVEERAPEARLVSVTLDTWANKFEIAVKSNGRVMPLNIAENIVDDLFDLGSTNAEQRFSEMLELCFLRLGVS